MSQWTGKWTVPYQYDVIELMNLVDMFAIFSLRRPDILPVGSLSHFDYYRDRR